MKGITVTDYSELEKFATHFAEGKHNLLFVIGESGHGKSKIFDNATAGKDVCLKLEGHFTPLAMYSQLYNSPDCRVWIDDVDELYRDSTKIAMLKALCQKDLRKTMRWQSSRKLLVEGSDIPPFFQT